MKVVLLLGPSSAGKSTLCDELRINHKWLVISQDDEAEKYHNNQKILMAQELRNQEISKALSPYMTEEEVIQLCAHGKFTMSPGAHRQPGDNRIIKDYQFSDPSLKTLDKVLKDAGFSGKEYDQIFAAIKKTADIHVNIMRKFDLDKIILEEAFKQRNQSDLSIIIDAVPGRSADTLLKAFLRSADEYRNKYPDQPLEVFTVLAYTSPQELSQRVLKRNIEADLKNNPQNKREGLFPFEQLGSLIKAGDEKKSVSEVSKDELLKIAYHHQRRPLIGVNKTKLKKVTEAALESVKLSKQFGLWKNNKDKIPLSIQRGLEFDIVINTTKGNPTPQILARTLIGSIEEAAQKRQAHEGQRPKTK